MKWLIAPFVGLLTLAIALLVLYRLWRGRNVVLRGRVSPRILRMVVIVLVVLGVGVEKGPAEPRLPQAKDASQPDGKTADLPTAINENAIRGWLRWNADTQDDLRTNSLQWRAFKQVFVQLEIEAGKVSRVSAETIASLIGQLEADEFTVRERASNALDQLGLAARPALRSALDAKPSLEMAMRIQKLLSRFDEMFRQARELTRPLPAHLQKMIVADLDALDTGKEAHTVSAEALLETLDSLEGSGLIGPWVTAYVWRKAGRIEDRREFTPLFARLHQHVRLANALVKVRAEVRPFVMPARAWMSKAGPSAKDRELEQKGVADVLQATRRLYPTSDIGTWQKDSVVLLTVAAGSAPLTLLRDGQERELRAGDVVRFNRLDLLVTPHGDKPSVVEDVWLGKLTLPANRTLAVWDLPQFLTEQAAKDARQAVAAALEGHDGPATQVERSLPLVQPIVREALREKPTAKGGPLLRLMITLFDDAVMLPAPLPLPEGK